MEELILTPMQVEVLRLAKPRFTVPPRLWLAAKACERDKLVRVSYGGRKSGHVTLRVQILPRGRLAVEALGLADDGDSSYPSRRRQGAAGLD